MMAMACVDNNNIVKEGTLHRYEKCQIIFQKQENKKIYYAKLEQHTSPVKSLMCCLYTNNKRTDLKHKIEIKNVSVEVDKHKYDSYICITPSNGPESFLHFKNNSERDEWYNKIVSTLGALQIPTIVQETEITPRNRLGTEPQDELQATVDRRRRNPPPIQRDVISSPSNGAHGFNIVLDEMKEKTKNKRDDPENTIECCIRHHIVAFHEDGTNMVYHPEEHYENIHFVLSEEDWHREIEAKQNSVKLHKEVYEDFHKLTLIQTPTPTNDISTQWPRKCQPSIAKDPAKEDLYENCLRHGRRSPVEDDERYPHNPIKANVNVFQHPCPPPPPIPNKNRRKSSMINRPLPAPPGEEDVAKVKNTFKRPLSNDYVTAPSIQDQLPSLPTVKNQPPPLPPAKGEKLKKSIKFLREEMRQQLGVTLDFSKSQVVGKKIALVEINDSLIVAGWERQSSALTNALHIGDTLTMINQQMLSSADFAHETMKLTAKDKVTLKLKRIPFGTLISIHKDHPGLSLGIKVDGNEITQVYPDGLASIQGNLRPQTAGITNHGFGQSNWAITEINLRPVGLNATTQQVEQMLQNTGEDVALVLHPVDFIQVLREKLASTNHRYSFS